MGEGLWGRSRKLVSSSAVQVSAKGRALDLESIHESHADFVWRSLQRMGVGPSDLEDAMQEAFLVVHRKLWTFDGTSSVSTWLFGICLRVASAQRRKAHRWRERGVSDWEEAAGVSEEGQPEAELLEREARVRLARVLDQLEPTRRAVLVMFEIERLPCAEIAALLGTPVGTVYSRLSAARADFLKAAQRFRREDERSASK